MWVRKINNNKKIKYILFDIDGVLVKATNSADEILEKNHLNMEEFFANWGDSQSVFDFETGKISQEDFARLRSEELENRISPATIIEILKARKSILFPGVEELLENLHRENYKLACLSNTNILHWNSIEGKMIFDNCFCIQFLSYQLGLVKPNKEIYIHVMETLQCKGHEILYFDDSKKNIETALELGWNAVYVQDFYDLEEKIKDCLKMK